MKKCKVCKLVNGNFSWMLIVDNQEISFQGAQNADYFAKHFETLGYDIKWEGQR